MAVFKRYARSIPFILCLLLVPALSPEAQAFVMTQGIDTPESAPLLSPALPDAEDGGRSLPDMIASVAGAESADLWDHSIHAASRAGLYEILVDTPADAHEGSLPPPERPPLISPALLLVGAGLLGLGALWRRIAASGEPWNAARSDAGEHHR